MGKKGYFIIAANPSTVVGGPWGPELGLMWTIIRIVLQLNTGTGTGTRVCSVLLGQGGIGSAGETLSSLSSTETSSTVQAVADATGQGGIRWNESPKLICGETLTAIPALVSGDSYSYFIYVYSEGIE